MGYSATTTPNTYMHGYSAVPLRLIDTNATELQSYQYVVNILSNTLTVSSVIGVGFGSNIYTKLTFATAHNFKAGEVLFLDDSSNVYTGYYRIQSVPSTTQVIIDLTTTVGFTGTQTVSSVIKYKMSPDPDGHAKLDLGNTLKDYVTQNLEDTNEIFAAPNTRFEYTILAGNESQEVFEFYDNYYYAGNVAFINTGITTTNQTSFKIGDTVTIKQNLFEVNYQSVFSYVNANGEAKLMLTLATTQAVLFERGPFTLYIDGQITYPEGNGYTTINTDYQGYTYAIFTNKDTTIPTGTTVNEGGRIYANISPEYDITTTIKNIVAVAGGVIIVTNLPATFNTPAIGGTIKSSTNKIKQTFDGPTFSGAVFNSFISKSDYTLTNMADKYVLWDTTNYGGISTILDSGTDYYNKTKYRIEKETKSWLLFHNTTPDLCDGVRFWFFDEFANTLGYVYVINASNNTKDFYCPVSINQLLACQNKIEPAPALSTYVNNISFYRVDPVKNVYGIKEPKGVNTVFYELTDDCSLYDMYHLMWKDAHGSWISLPFKYASTQSTEVDRSNYYKNAHNWDNNTFGYDKYAKGDTSYFVRGRDKLVLNSGWLYEYENVLIKDMLISAAVYVQFPDGNLYACIIQDNEITFGSKNNNDIFQYKISVKMANDQIRL